MTKEFYLKITGKLREDSKKRQRVKRLNRILTSLVMMIYPLFLIFLFLEKDGFLMRAVLVPAISFFAVTVFRRLYNAPRPYEKFGVPPVLEKDTKGKSFPSRHVFSVFIIAMTVFYLHPGAGIMLWITGAILGIIRVAGGVHEPRDVIAGAAAGIISGVIGYYLI